MKYIIIFFACSLLFMGCNQQNINLVTTTTDTSGSVVTGFQNIYSEGNLSSSAIISGMHNSLIISGTTFIDSGFFTLHIPVGLTTWEYDGRIDTVNDIHFGYFLAINETGYQYININVGKIFTNQKTLSEQELCHKEYMDKFISYTTGTKNVAGKNLYIDYTKIQITTLEKSSRIKQEARICFVHSGMIYTLGIGGYSTKDIDNFIDSLHFY